MSATMFRRAVEKHAEVLRAQLASPETIKKEIALTKQLAALTTDKRTVNALARRLEKLEQRQAETGTNGVVKELLAACDNILALTAKLPQYNTVRKARATKRSKKS